MALSIYKGSMLKNDSLAYLKFSFFRFTCKESGLARRLVRVYNFIFWDLSTVFNNNARKTWVKSNPVDSFTVRIFAHLLCCFLSIGEMLESLFCRCIIFVFTVIYFAIVLSFLCKIVFWSDCIWHTHWIKNSLFWPIYIVSCNSLIRLKFT